jgi:hypothetical protein
MSEEDSEETHDNAVGLAKWKARGYKHIASHPKQSISSKISDIVHKVRLPQKKAYSHSSAEAESQGYPVQGQKTSRFPSRQRIDRFIMGDPAVRKKKKEERKARKERYASVKAKAYEEGMMKGLAKRGYAEGYRRGRGSTGRGGSGLSNTLVGLNRGAENVASMFGYGQAKGESQLANEMMGIGSRRPKHRQKHHARHKSKRR